MLMLKHVVEHIAITQTKSAGLKYLKPRELAMEF